VCSSDLSSAQAAALLVEPGMRAMVCGGEGLREAVAGRGAYVVAPHLTTEPDDHIDTVVVGFYREFTWDIMRRAATAVRNGARLIGANSDPTYPTPNGPIPGGGSVLAAIERASETSAVVAGKPHEPMARLVAQMTDNLPPEDMVMIGDRSDTDGAFARLLSCRFTLVLSGSTSAHEASDADFVAADLSEAVDQLCS
jgi:4-nitrophenyl phosphatase